MSDATDRPASRGVPQAAGSENGAVALIETLFRREAGRLVSGLTKRFGPRRLPLVEESVQEAMLRALRLWPFQGIPAEPAAWLWRVAQNRCLDQLRGPRPAGLEAAGLPGSALAAPPAEPDEPGDDVLRMMFLACHPGFSPETRVAFTLKTVGGFGVPEIARAFLAEETAIAQRLVRARQRIVTLGLCFELPPARELEERLQSVLEVVYLLFNEGHAACGGDDLVRADLCAEALRLGRLLAGHQATGLPKTHALVALMLLHAARLPARTDAAGDLQLLQDQDRARWDRRLIAEGLHHLGRCAAGDELSAWHIEAGIAAAHATAESFAATDWSRIVGLYDDLLRHSPSPVVRLNRAVALAQARGVGEALSEIEELAAEPRLSRWHLFHAVRGDLLQAAGDRDAAAAAFVAALAHGGTGPERRFLERRLLALRGPTPL